MTVSVCIITYNHEKYISQAIESILIQKTNFEYEIVIGEDNSNDSTKKICQRFIAKPNIKLVLNQHNLGMMNNFINTLKQCKGKYIAICEGDDYWIDEYKLQKQVDYLEKNPDCSMVITDRLIETENGQTQKDAFYDKSMYTIVDVIKGFVPPTQTIVFRNNQLYTTFLSNVPVDASGGDRFLGFFFSLIGYIYRIEEVTAVYRITGKGFWTSESNFNKLISAYSYLSKFHSSLGIPKDNIYLKQYAFDVIVNIIFYTFKRPWLLLKHSRIIFNIYKDLAWSNHLFLFFKSVLKKLKSFLQK